MYPFAERLERRDVGSQLQMFEAEMAWPFSERRSRSWAAVVDTVHRAAAHVPYYRDLFGRIGFDPEKLARDPRYLQDIPYLTKNIIRAEGQRLLRDDHTHIRKHISRTGGSTGPAALIFYDQPAADLASAVTRAMRRTIGKSQIRSELHFASKFPEEFPLLDRMRERAKSFAMNRFNIFFSSFDADELESIWRKIVHIRPYLVHGHPSIMYQVALHVADRSLSDPPFRVFESSGELLDEQHRDTIIHVFQCRVVNRYGLAEAGIIAYQVGLSDRTMLILDPVVWPEIAYSDDKEGEKASLQGGRFGELVLTATKNRMMPLIRYRTGDMAVLSETPRGFVLDKLVGRTHDIVDIGKHRMPTHYIQDVLGRIGGIREFQIERRDRATVLRIIAEDAADFGAIRDRVRSFWQDGIDVEFIALSELHLSGERQKFRRVVLRDAPSVEAPPNQE